MPEADQYRHARALPALTELIARLSPGEPVDRIGVTFSKDRSADILRGRHWSSAENFGNSATRRAHRVHRLRHLRPRGAPVRGPQLRANRLPLVVLGKPLGFEDAFSWVAIDDEKAAFTVVSYLVARVGGPIGTVTGPMHTSSGRDRLDGYLRGVGNQITGRIHQPVHVLLNSELVERASA
jgi:hypothetical protein